MRVSIHAVGLQMLQAVWACLILLVCTASPHPVRAAEQATSPAKPRRYALLVGCTKYDYHEELSLEGPANDVVLMRQTLIERCNFSPERIRTLSESPDAAGRPTRANIEAEFKRLSESVQRGDQVVVLLAGHGSQQPDQDHDSAVDPEPDGQDETFLPCDVKSWAKNTVVNAIIDDELGRWTREIAGKDVFVWMIFDSCHCGTAMRDAKLAGEDVSPFKVRRMGPDSLGVPEAGHANTRDFAVQTRGVGDDGASVDQLAADLPIVALYAAQSYETEKECKLPLSSERGQWRGLLAYSVCQMLQQGPLPTYRELQQSILAQYRKWGFSEPTPAVEGKDLDHIVLDEKPRPPRFQLGDKTEEGWNLEAGLLHGLTQDSVLAVSPPRSIDGPAPGESKPGQEEPIVGYVRVVSSDVSRSIVQPCAYAELAAVPDLPEHGLCKVVYRDLGSLKLRVTVDRVGRESDPVLDQIAGQLADGEKQPDALFEVEPELRRAHWAVQFRDGGYWLLPADQASTAGPLPSDVTRTSIPTPPDAQRMVEVLNRAARVHNLLELCQPESTDRSATGSVAEFDVRFEMVKLKSKLDRQGEPLAVERPIILRPGDWVAWRISNGGVAAADVTVLFVDSQLAIVPVFPSRNTVGNNRFLGGSSFLTAPSRVTGTTIGHEQIVAIAVKGEGPPKDFLFLAQPSLARAMASRGFGDESPLAKLLKTANYRDGTSRGLDTEDLSSYSVRVFSWNVASTR